MPLRVKFSNLTWAMLLVASVLLGFYSWLGFIGFWFVGHSSMHIKDYVLLYQPLLAFPLLLVLLASLRVAVISLWCYIAVTIVIYFFASWPRISLQIFSSKADYSLIAAAMLLQLSLLIESRRRTGGKRPGRTVKRQTSSFNGLNQIDGYSYNANGNQNTDAMGDSLSFDANGMLSSVRSGAESLCLRRARQPGGSSQFLDHRPIWRYPKP